MTSVLRETKDGTLILSYAILCPRTIPPKWKCGNTPIDELPDKIIAWGEEAERMFKQRTKE